MTATEPRIIPHDELNLHPAPLIPEDRIAFDGDESRRRGRFISVYSVLSSNGTDAYTVVYHARMAQWYCDCPAGQHGHLCKHINSIAYYNAFNQAYRAYITCDDAELRVYERDMARRMRGDLCTYRGWTIDNDALADVVAERAKRRVA